MLSTQDMREAGASSDAIEAMIRVRNMNSAELDLLERCIAERRGVLPEKQ